jgi:transposase
MSEGIFLKTKDQLLAEIVYKISSKQISRSDGIKLLGVSQRTLERYLRDFNKEGITFVSHGNRKRPPVNKTAEDLKETIQTLVQEKYFDFNMLHCLEKIREELGVEIKRETFRKWCHEIKAVKRSKRRRTYPRYRRERMSQAGLMLLMDGSHHRWFADVECCLNAAIDDATGEVPYAEFSYGETTWACLKVLRKIVEKKGIFRILYVDKAGVYGGIKRQGFSQVQRALNELGTQVIFAHSPEAKGRIERLWDTLQDRLIPEMRLKGIKSMDAANDYLQNTFLPHQYHPRFVVQAHNPQSAYIPVHPSHDLSSIFLLKEHRQVARDHTISLAGEKYLIDEHLKYSIHNQKLEIRKEENGQWQAFYAGKPIRLIKINQAKKILCS